MQIRELWSTLRRAVAALYARLAKKATAPIVTSITSTAIQPAPTPEPVPLPSPSNRATRRALERARRRHDKFLIPKKPKRAKGEGSKSITPPKLPKPKEEEVLASDIVDDPNDLIIVDNLYGDGDVLVEETEIFGEFNFRDSILDQLDRYWFYLERMRKADPDSYELYRQIGALLLPYSACNLHHLDEKDDPIDIKKLRSEIALPPWFLQRRPSFGCIAIGANSITEKHELDQTAKLKKNRYLDYVKFMYFTKYAMPPPEFQPMSGGDVYKVTVYWDRFHGKRKHGAPQEFGVFVSRDGKEIKVLKMCETKRIPIRKKKGYGTFTIPQRAWRIPSLYEEWASDKGLRAADHLAHLFCDAIKHYEFSQYSVVRVEVCKGDLTAVFGISPKRTSYFFKDRDVVVDGNGVTRPIFHQVRVHERNIGSRSTYVRPHFRGLKEFTWAGYQVKITVPGLDHFLPSDFDVGAHDEYWKEKGIKYVDTKKVGRFLVDAMKRGVGGVGNAGTRT